MGASHQGRRAWREARGRDVGHGPPPGGRGRGAGPPGGVHDGGRATGGGGGDGAGARREEERGGGGEEREGEGRGAHLEDPNSGDHRLQDLGHHGEREIWERERLLRGRIEMRERDQRRGARAWGGHGRQGRTGRDRAGPCWVGLGWAGPHRGAKIPWHTQPQIRIQFVKQNPKRN
jgi:hypothetical protein